VYHQRNKQKKSLLQHDIKKVVINYVADLRLLWRWRFSSRTSGLWRHVVLWYDTYVSEVHVASIMRLKMEATLHGATTQKTSTCTNM